MSTRKERKERRHARAAMLRLSSCAYGTHSLEYLTPALNRCVKCGGVYSGAVRVVDPPA